MQKNWPPRKWNEEARVRAEQRAYAKAAARGDEVEKPSIAWADTSLVMGTPTFTYYTGDVMTWGMPATSRRKRPLSPEEMMEDAIDAAVRAARGAV